MKVHKLCACALVFTLSCQASPYLLTTSSPDQTLKVQLIESIRSSKEPYDFLVRLMVEKNGSVIIDNPRFASSDGQDRRFGAEHPGHKWLSNNILWVGDNGATSTDKKDLIRINNKSSKPIKYLAITGYSEIFLIFDLPQNESLEIESRSQNGLGQSWIGYGGQFDDGRVISWDGMNFRTGSNINPPAHYCLTIMQNQVSASSLEFEGFKLSSGVERVLPKTANCDRP